MPISHHLITYFGTTKLFSSQMPSKSIPLYYVYNATSSQVKVFYITNCTSWYIVVFSGYRSGPAVKYDMQLHLL